MFGLLVSLSTRQSAKLPGELKVGSRYGSNQDQIKGHSPSSKDRTYHKTLPHLQFSRVRFCSTGNDRLASLKDLLTIPL